MSEILVKVEQYAKSIYKDLFRISGEPLYNHVKKVEIKLEEIGINNEVLLSTALLHEVGQTPNPEARLKEIENLFGPDIHKLIKKYLDAASFGIKLNTPNKKNLDLIIQTFLSLANDLDVLLIVLASKTVDTQTLHALEEVRRERSANRGTNIYAPLCRFVGLNKFADEIEENTFKVLHPRDYIAIKKAIKDKEVVTKIYLNDLTSIIKEYLLDNGISAEVKYRIKKPYSIFKKHLNKSINYGELNDIAGIRIIVSRVDQCYKVDALIKNEWNEEISLRDDYIAKPKASGYKSLHAYYYFEKGMPFEVQIRTKEMHEMNEYGRASHLFYKMGDALKKYKVEDPKWLKEIEFGEKYSSIEFKQFSNFVYTFTPKGDIIELPKGSTVLDFAYYIHEDVGNYCKGAIVNGNIQKLSYTLRNGDNIDIKVSNKINVNMDWSKIAKTSKAKKNIRQVVRETKHF